MLFGVTPFETDPKLYFGVSVVGVSLPVGVETEEVVLRLLDIRTITRPEAALPYPRIVGVRWVGGYDEFRSRLKWVGGRNLNQKLGSGERGFIEEGET